MRSAGMSQWAKIKSVNNVKRQVFVKETRCVFCDVRKKFIIFFNRAVSK